MYRIEAKLDKYIQKVVRKNILKDENEMEYWNRHWVDYIVFFKENGIPKEIENEWWKNLYNEMLVSYETVLGDLEGMEICEIGSGSGYLSLLMAQKGAKVTLVDFAPNSKIYAECICKYLKIDLKEVSFLLKNGFNLDNNAKKFDIVWNCGVIEHYYREDAIILIKAMMKQAKPGGKVMVILPNLLSPELIYKMIIEGKGSEIYYSYRLLKNIMEKAGLKEVNIYPINYWVPSFLPASLANNMRKRNICKYIKGLAWLFYGIGQLSE